MQKLTASTDAMVRAIDELSGKLNQNLGAAMGTIPDNIDTIGKRWALKNAEILKNYGCNADCVDMYAGRGGRNW